MTKPLMLVHAQLRHLLDAKEECRRLVLPSDADAGVDALNRLSGQVLQGGGAERLFQLVADAVSRGER